MITRNLGLLALTCLPLLAGGTARAGVMDGLGTWRGTGAAFDRSGAELGRFNVTLDRKAVDDHTVEAKGTVTLSQGKTIPFSQRITSNGNRFRLVSDRGQGGGVCFGEGLCQSYEDAGDGHGWATTIVVDGPDRLRILITELQGGQAVRFMRQSLTRRK